jgi:hypothetical protein
VQPSEGRPGRPDSQNLGPEERRRRFEERVKNATPEERERMLERMRQRETSQPHDAGTRSQRVPARATQPIRGAQGTAAADVPRTIDALFGALPTTESAGRVWRYVDGRLAPVRVRLGVTDGTNTELISGDLPEGAPLVTGVLLQAATSPTEGGTRSPLMGPQRGPGGPRGGGRR